MRSTGEVMGIDSDFGRAFAKAELGAGERLPLSGTVFVSMNDRDKAAAVPVVKELSIWALLLWLPMVLAVSSKNMV